MSDAELSLIDERDYAEGWADTLAYAIADYFSVDIGEHSNLNKPWQNAVAWLDRPWRGIETAPTDGTHILVRSEGSPQQPPTTAHWFEGGWHLSVNALGEHSEHGMQSLSHWMPLPPTD